MRFKIISTAVFIIISLVSQGQYMMMKAESLNISFRAESRRPGHTDKTEILGYMMEVKSPRDAASGMSTGKRQYQPVILWKLSGASSPQFYEALIRNDMLKKITFQYYRPDEVYKQNELVYTVELENVSVAGYRQLMGSPDVPEFKARQEGLYDEIKLVFDKITVTENKARTSATDAWKSNN